MNFLNGKKTYLVALGGVLSSVAGYLTGTMSPAEAIQTLITSLLGATIRNGVSSAVAAVSSTPAAPATPAPAPAPTDTAASGPGKVVPAVLGFLLAGVLAAVVGLPGCATAPTQSQQADIDVAVNVAVSIAVQRGTSDAAVWASRAGTIVSIAQQTLPLASGDTVDVAALTAAISPLLDKANLTPDQRLIANTLISALAGVIDANVPTGKPQAATVVLVLNDVIKSASVYLPMSKSVFVGTGTPA